MSWIDEMKGGPDVEERGGASAGGRGSRRRARGILGWALAALLLHSCGPKPAPEMLPTPPAPEAPGEEIPVPGVPPVFDVHQEPSLDVGLAVDLDSLTVAPSARMPLGTAARGGEINLGETSAAVRVQRIKQGWQIVWKRGDAGELVTSLWPQDTLWIGWAADAAEAADNRIGWKGRSWRGRFKIFLNPRSKLTLATRLPLETYLRGVVPSEIGGLSQELIEAGRAQAIAARSYTLFYRGRRGDEGFDLYGTVEDQVYGSIETEQPLADRCVESTRGQVQLWDGWPIRANYCATCGGITADVWEAWSATPMPYLASHLDGRGSRSYCEASANYRWREEWTAKEFLSNLRNYGPAQGVRVPAQGLGELVDVRVESRSRSGRVWQLVVETTTGSIEVPAYALRRVLHRSDRPQAILRSNLFKIDVRRNPSTRRAQTVVASGGGSGHGVGLCQSGAIGMARAGVAAPRILAHYYPGADLKRIY